MAGGVYRAVFSVIFDDLDYQRLTPNARLTLLTLRQCREAGPAAIFLCATEALMRQTGLSKRAVIQALAELERGRWIVHEAPVVWVRNGLRHDPWMSLSNPKHRAAVVEALHRLPKLQIILTFCDYYTIAYPFEWVSDRHTDTHAHGLTKSQPASRTPPGYLDVSRDAVTKTDTHAQSLILSTDPDPELGRGVGEPREPAAGAAHSAERLAAHAPRFKIPTAIAEALAKCPRLGACPKLATPAWWQAELRANPGVAFDREVLKAEAWLACKNGHYRDYARFLHSWLSRAERPEVRP